MIVLAIPEKNLITIVNDYYLLKQSIIRGELDSFHLIFGGNFESIKTSW